MKGKKLVGTIVSAVLSTALFAASAEAGGAFAGGASCSTQTRGDRLEGVVHIAFDQNADALTPLCQQGASIQATIRLANRDVRKTFYSVVHVPAEVCDPCTVVHALLADAGLKAEILDTFYGGDQSHTIGVSEVTQLSGHTEESCTTGEVHYRTLANVVVTVQ